MDQSNPERPRSWLQRLADIAGLIFRAMGSEMGMSSQEVMREERREKRKRYSGRRHNQEHGRTDSDSE